MERKALVFGGTTEARELLELGLPAVCCVTTEYGAKLLDGIKNLDVIVRRLDSPQMADIIRERRIACVVDATHPYAVIATENIKRACHETGVPLLRLLRDEAEPDGSIVKAASCAEAAELLNCYDGAVLLTVGSKELQAFTSVNDCQKRIFARVLPASDVVKKCEDLGFDAGHIIALQGPFSLLMNEEMLRMTKAEVLVTKNSGKSGGADLKFEAAKNLGVKVILIERPDEEGCSVQEAFLWARRMLGFPADINAPDLKISGEEKI